LSAHPESKKFPSSINFAIQLRALAIFLQLVSMFSAFSPSTLALNQIWWACLCDKDVKRLYGGQISAVRLQFQAAPKQSCDA